MPGAAASAKGAAAAAPSIPGAKGKGAAPPAKGAGAAAPPAPSGKGAGPPVGKKGAAPPAAPAKGGGKGASVPSSGKSASKAGAAGKGGGKQAAKQRIPMSNGYVNVPWVALKEKSPRKAIADREKTARGFLDELEKGSLYSKRMERILNGEDPDDKSSRHWATSPENAFFPSGAASLLSRNSGAGPADPAGPSASARGSAASNGRASIEFVTGGNGDSSDDPNEPKVRTLWNRSSATARGSLGGATAASSSSSCSRSSSSSTSTPLVVPQRPSALACSFLLSSKIPSEIPEGVLVFFKKAVSSKGDGAEGSASGSSTGGKNGAGGSKEGNKQSLFDAGKEQLGMILWRQISKRFAISKDDTETCRRFRQAFLECSFDSQKEGNWLVQLELLCESFAKGLKEKDIFPGKELEDLSEEDLLDLKLPHLHYLCHTMQRIPG